MDLYYKAKQFFYYLLLNIGYETWIKKYRMNYVGYISVVNI